MKTPEEWDNELLNNPWKWKSSLQFIENIQKDALSNSMTNTTDQQELEMARRIAMNERIRADQLHEELMKWREECNETCRQQRKATKDEYKNALIAELETLKQILQKNNQTKTN